MKKTALKFGGYGLLVALVIFLSALYFGQGLSYSTQEVLGYLSIIISLSFVFFGIKHYRDRENEGKVGFGKAILIGILISLITSLGFAIGDYIYTTAINPDFFEEYRAAMQAEGQNDMPEFTSAMGAAIMFFTVALIGFIVSLISALILQKK